MNNTEVTSNEVKSTPAAHWREEGKPDPHGDRFNRERAKLCMGDATDDEIANEYYMSTKPTIVQQTAVKERIRWLSRRAIEAHRIIGLLFKGLKTSVRSEKSYEVQFQKLVGYHNRYVVYTQSGVKAAADAFDPAYVDVEIDVRIQYPAIAIFNVLSSDNGIRYLHVDLVDLEQSANLINITDLSPMVPYEPDQVQYYDPLVRQIVNWMGYEKPTPNALRAVIRRCVTRTLPEWLEVELKGRGVDHVVDNASRAVILYKAMVHASSKIQSVESIQKEA